MRDLIRPKKLELFFLDEGVAPAAAPEVSNPETALVSPPAPPVRAEVSQDSSGEKSASADDEEDPPVQDCCCCSATDSSSGFFLPPFSFSSISLFSRISSVKDFSSTCDFSLFSLSWEVGGIGFAESLLLSLDESAALLSFRAELPPPPNKADSRDLFPLPAADLFGVLVSVTSASPLLELKMRQVSMPT